MVMGRIHHARVLLGSATPSLESYFLALGKKYGLVELNERYGSGNLPEIIFADMRSERKHKTAKGDFSSLLIEQAREVLLKDEQVIIFQNRRGYSPYITCEECNWIPKCPHCAVSLTYHMYGHQLRCHYCGFYEPLPAACNACGSTRLRTVGTGTEKLEEDLRLLFPDSRIQRMDLDTTRSKYSYQRIINDFEEGDIDILVGTQMVTKGLDFDKVSLVGIFDIDRMLHFPDFRAAERAFHLSVQVSGRAGRKDMHGRVIVQTADPKQPILKYIAFHNYRGFYNAEINERNRFRYPPFHRLIKITCKHPDKDMVNLGAAEYFRLLKQDLDKDWLLAPHEPLISKIRNMYLMDIIVKLGRGKVDLKKVKDIIRKHGLELETQKAFRKLKIVWDVDPY
jgi:primosomal protein N' (replication factor Y)